MVRLCVERVFDAVAVGDVLEAGNAKGDLDKWVAEMMSVVGGENESAKLQGGMYEE